MNVMRANVSMMKEVESFELTASLPTAQWKQTNFSGALPFLFPWDVRTLPILVYRLACDIV